MGPRTSACGYGRVRRPARATHLIGLGGADGHAWSVTAYVGPWGECVLTRAGGSISSGCDPVSSPQGTSLLGSTSGSPGVEYGSAAADVQHVVITVTGGRTIRVRTITAGEQKFFAFPLSRGQHAVRWRAYDQPGTRSPRAASRGCKGPARQYWMPGLAS